ncbi:MAG TPA: class I adenylate-forming enzyme family protein, partial [Vicinamibacterales bacterium]|nr:class I adenylate-forming enzyme family protein [Vicinamibacterales bacterium]
MSDGLIDRLRRVAREHADRTFLIESMTNRSWTYAEFYDSGLKAAAMLSANGIQRGDRVALLLANSCEFAALYFGCFMLGAVAVPVNQALHHDEIAYILGRSGAKLLLFSRCTRALVLKATEGVRHLPQWRVALGQEASFHPEDAEDVWSLETAAVEPSLASFAGAADDDPIAVLFTSGTSGRPKGVVRTIRTDFGNAEAFNTMMGFDPDVRMLHIWPMAYSTGLMNTLISPWMCGGSTVLAPAFTAQTILNFWKPVVDHGVNTLWLSPTMMASMVRLDRDRRGIDYCRQRITTVCAGTAPLPHKLKRQFHDVYGVEPLESYGLSELMIISSNVPSRPRP